MSTTNTAPDPEDLVALLDVIDNYPGAAALRARSIELLAAPPGAVIVDVGCGAGRAVAEMAEQGWDGLGIDLDEHMLTIARRRWPHCRFEKADAAELPLADHSVQGYRAEKVFHDIADPTAALTEAHRVLAPGGRIVLIGQDCSLVKSSVGIRFVGRGQVAGSGLGGVPRASSVESAWWCVELPC